MARRKELKDVHVRNMPPAQTERAEYADTEVRGLVIRVTRKGTKTFALYTRFPGSTAPSHRSLGEYGTVSLAEAREKARAWKSLIARGIDPKHEEERRRVAEQRKRETTFRAVAEDFVREKLPSERNGKIIERDLRRDLIPAWGAYPITEITREQVAALIKRKRSTPVAARNLLALIKRLFTWAIYQEAYGLTDSPATVLKATKLIGDRNRPRDRFLSDDELRSLWRSARRLPYPHGAVYRLLMLTALRLNEAAEASWSEFDPAVVRALRLRKPGEIVDWRQFKSAHLVWTIPAARMKGKNSRARAHTVPLTGAILDLLCELPTVSGGDFLFSTTGGESPAWIGDKIKKKLDALMLDELQTLASSRGEDGAPVTLAAWTNHDIRRTVRSGLSKLRISEAVSEALLAHVRPGVIGIYDRHDYLEDKRDALQLWEAHLRSIVEPPEGTNIIRLESVRASAGV